MQPFASGRTTPASVFILLFMGWLAVGACPSHAAFTDVSSSSGITLADHTYGLGWGDFELDGDPDLLVIRHFYRPIVYRNNGVGGFNYVHSPPLFDASDHHGPLIADFDEDGDPDIYLTSGADAGTGTVPKKLYRNDGLDDEGRMMFVDVAPEWGLGDDEGRGRSSSAMDVDGDGALDIFVAKAPRLISPNSLFMNDGAGHFTDMAASVGIADTFGSVGGVWGDYDNDRDPDLLIGGEENLTYETRLYRNDGGQFTNVTAQALPAGLRFPAADWGDYDKDGDLDLAAGLGDEAYFDAITWNADALTFFFNARGTDNGLDGFAFVQSGDSSTYDLYTNGFYQANFIFISEDGHAPGPFSPFTLASDIFGAPDIIPGATIGTYLWTDSLFGIWQTRCNAPPGAGITFAGVITTNGDILDIGPTELEPYTHGPRGTRLYRNDAGTFTNVTLAAGVSDQANVRQVGWFDFDLDGRLDLFVMNKGDTEVQNQPDLLYHNEGDGSFTEVSVAQGLVGPTNGIGDGFAIEDVEGDGDLDVAMLSGAGPRFFSIHSPHRLYRNDGPTGNSLRVDLEGVLSTKDGYGAWVTCVSASTGRQVHYVTGNSWRGGHVLLEPVFGLGTDAEAESLIVFWPSNAATVLTNVPAGNVVVNEGEPVLGSPEIAGAPVLSIAARPNPSTSEVSFAIQGRGKGTARVTIHDTAGRLVAERSLGEGVESARWDGRTNGGGRAASGIYFARLHEGSRSALTRIVLLRR